VVSAQDHHGVGPRPYLDVPDLERSHFIGEQRLLQLGAEALQDAVNLYVALGRAGSKTSRAD
jgi:hypothetical protein